METNVNVFAINSCDADIAYILFQLCVHDRQACFGQMRMRRAYINLELRFGVQQEIAEECSIEGEVVL